ncbi:MAG: lipoprotein [Reyranellaceae bacterium]
MMENDAPADASRRTLLRGLLPAAILALAACGKKGDLEPPPEAKDRKPRSYPKPQ